MMTTLAIKRKPEGFLIGFIPCSSIEKLPDRLSEEELRELSRFFRRIQPILLAPF